MMMTREKFLGPRGRNLFRSFDQLPFSSSKLQRFFCINLFPAIYQAMQFITCYAKLNLC